MGNVVELPPERQRQRQHTEYRLPPRRGQRSGTRVPSVTKILGTLSNEALLNWANRQGLAGIDIRTDYRDRTIGTLAHLGIQHILGAERPDVSEYVPEWVEQARCAVANWRHWYREHEVEPLHMEMPLVHKEFEYGGTFDCLAYVDGTLTLLDWKTSGNPVPYPSHFAQLAAYAELLRANDFPMPELLRVVAFSRERDNNPPFRTEPVEDWEPHLRVFLAALEAYNARLVVGF
jgi:hypothetical protein